MLPRSNSMGWIGEKEEENPTISSLKSMLEVENEWYSNFANPIPSDNLVLNPIDSSSSCSPSPSVFNPSHVPFFSNPLDGFFTEDIGGGILDGFNDFNPNLQMGTCSLMSNPQISTAHLVPTPQNDGFVNGGSRVRGFDEGFGGSMFMNRGSKLLKPLDNSAPPVGSPPTLFQKRAALRKNLVNSEGNNNEKQKEKVENVSINGTTSFNYDSDDFTENNNGNSVPSGGINNVGEDSKGKKKGVPAKNLMAERRRRKKLNDRLYMLRSIVPKISKMDRASILGDAIEYLKELLQKINDLHNELESTPPSSSLTHATSFHPLTPTLPNFPSRIKEEFCPSSLPSPNGQPTRIEVRIKEGRAMNIHMFCGRRPGLLLSTLRTLDGLGLDIQQAVISCFNGFAMDIFRAEQCKDGEDVHPDHIKALLLDVAAFHGSTSIGNCEM